MLHHKHVLAFLKNVKRNYTNIWSRWFFFCEKKNFAKKIVFAKYAHFPETMPSQCVICANWFAMDVRCCKECDELEDFKNMCGICSGIGPYNQKYIPTPNAYVVESINLAKYDRDEHRRQEVEQRRQEAEKLKSVKSCVQILNKCLD